MKTNTNIRLFSALCAIVLSASGCGSSHSEDADAGHEGSDAGSDSGHLTDAHVDPDLGPPGDGGPFDACASLTCYRSCGEGLSACGSSQTTASNCDGSCPSGYKSPSECTDLILMCPDADAGTGPDSGTPPDWTACEQNTDCTVIPRSCCGACGAATPSDMIAVNDAHASDYSASVCVGALCPACAGMPDPYLVGVCESNHCVARDLRATEIGACNDSSECQVRVASCCECGSESTGPWIAINASQEAAYESIVCSPGDCSGGGECTEYPGFPFGLCTGDSVTSGYCFLGWGED